MKRFVVLALVFGMLATMFAVGPGSERAAATQAEIVGESTVDGFLYSGEAIYANALTGPADAAIDNNDLRVGQKYLAPTYYVYRSYLSFNTSGIDDNVTILSATLFAYWASDYSTTADFSVNVYNLDYGATLTTGDWAAACPLYMGTLLTTGAFTASYRSLSVSPDTVSLDGRTQYWLKSSREGLTPAAGDQSVVLTSANGASKPYMNITYTSAAYGTTYYGKNQTITIPASNVMDWNNTHKLAEYRVNSLASTWVNLTAATGSTYSTVYPTCNVTDFENTANLTGFDWYGIHNTSISVWFYQPISTSTTFHLSVWAQETGRGYAFETWPVYWCELGLIEPGACVEEGDFQMINASRCWSPEIKLTMGYYYGFGVVDYYGVLITAEVTTADVLERDVSIALPMYSLTVDNQSPSSATVNVLPQGGEISQEVIVAAKNPYYFELCDGTYTVNATFNQGGRAGETLWWNVTMSDGGEVVYIPGQYNAYIQVTNNLTGQGWPWGSWRVFWNAGTAPNNATWQQTARDFVGIDVEGNYTFTAVDLFGQQLGNDTVNVVDPLVFVNISFAEWPLTIENQNDDAVIVRFFRGGVAWPIDEHIPGRQFIRDKLFTDSYVVSATYVIGSYTNQTVWFYFNVTNSTYLRINGTTITAIYVTLDGMVVLVNQITQALLPGMVLWSDNPALVPCGTRGIPDDDLITLDPWMIMWGTTHYWDDGAGGGIIPGFNATGMPGSVTILDDKVSVLINTTTDFWFNNTELGYVHAAPTAFSKVYSLAGNATGGDAATVETSPNWPQVTLERDISFRYAESFNWTYDQSDNEYRCAISVRNDFAAGVTITWPQVFVPFYNDTFATGSQVNVWDADNMIWLEQGESYDVSSAGVRWEFAQLAVGESRNFTISFDGYTQPTPTSKISVAPKVAQPQLYEYNGKTYWMFEYAYTNFGSGPVYPTMALTMYYDGAANIDPSSIIVLDASVTGWPSVGSTGWSYNSYNVEIDQTIVGTIQPGESRTYVILFLDGSAASQTGWFVGEPSPFLMCLAVTIALIAVSLVLMGAYPKKAGSKSNVTTYLRWALTIGAGGLLATLGLTFALVLMGGT